MCLSFWTSEAQIIIYSFIFREGKRGRGKGGKMGERERREGRGRGREGKWEGKERGKGLGVGKREGRGRGMKEERVREVKALINSCFLRMVGTQNSKRSGY